MTVLSGNPDGFDFEFECQWTMEKGNRLTICCPDLHKNSTCQVIKQNPQHLQGTSTT
jgi:hypothetical protein